MIPTPERIRNAKIWSAIASFVTGSIAASLSLALAESQAARIGLLAGTVVLIISVYQLGTTRMRRRVAILSRPFAGEWDRILTERVAFYTALKEGDRDRFRKMVSVFLGETRITGINVEVDDECRLLVAASAIIPVFGFPVWEYSMLREVLIYPHRFDGDDGLSGEDANTLGMVGGTGSAINGLMILSKPDLYRGFEQHGDRHNVGIHEFAHLVDKADGAIDGIPAGMPRECIGPWVRLVREELDSRRDATGKRRHGGTDIPEYAYTNEQEFLAVTTEYFFESPENLAERHPEIYNLLHRAFHQDTQSRFTDVVKRIFKPSRRSTGRNAPCPCGSGKKYKKCCLKKARN